jgi:hypothetical protein
MFSKTFIIATTLSLVSVAASAQTVIVIPGNSSEDQLRAPDEIFQRCVLTTAGQKICGAVPPNPDNVPEMVFDGDMNPLACVAFPQMESGKVCGYQIPMIDPRR